MELWYSNNLEVFMQLKDFISNALVEICSGIAEAKTQIGNHALAPYSITTPTGETEEVHKIEQIQFEVCVTVGDSNSLKDKNGFEFGILQVVSAKIGKNEDSKSNKTEVNKISFSVPYLPQAIITSPEKCK